MKQANLSARRLATAARSLDMPRKITCWNLTSGTKLNQHSTPLFFGKSRTICRIAVG